MLCQTEAKRQVRAIQGTPFANDHRPKKSVGGGDVPNRKQKRDPGTVVLRERGTGPEGRAVTLRTNMEDLEEQVTPKQFDFSLKFFYTQ